MGKFEKVFVKILAVAGKIIEIVLCCFLALFAFSFGVLWVLGIYFIF